MVYYMLGFDVIDSISIDDVNKIVASMLVLTYSPHLWKSSIADLFAGWVRAMRLRGLADLPRDVALRILRNATEQALTALGGD